MDYNRHVGIDLHIHTTASDGTFTPAEVVAHALKLKLKAIAITDHDTLAGSKEALGRVLSQTYPELNHMTRGVSESVDFFQ